MNIIQTLQANPNGCTLDATTGHAYSFRRGFAVSLTDNVCLSLEPQEINAALQSIHATARQLHLKRYFVGYWYDSARRVHCLDLTIIERSKVAALRLGKLFGQAAIFDFQSLSAVPV